MTLQEALSDHSYISCGNEHSTVTQIGTRGKDFSQHLDQPIPVLPAGLSPRPIPPRVQLSPRDTLSPGLHKEVNNSCLRHGQFSSVAQSCPTLCDPMACNTPGLPVHHQLPELTQTHVHRVGDAIQPSHPLSSPSPLALNLSQHQGLFQ